MTDAFHKFPHTPHLLWLGPGLPRDDKVLKSAEVTDFLSRQVIVEEKIDGANLGISLGPDGHLRAQSRGNYLVSGRSHSQWNPLWPWLAQRRDILERGLSAGLMLFGEWCYARHTVPYDTLPDWFLGFDIFELESRRFWSVERRNAWLHEHGLGSVPEVRRGKIQLNDARSLLGTSAVGHVPMEGIYLRRERGEFLQSRAKVVSAAFNQKIEEHWTRRSVIPNHLAMAHV